MSQDAEGPQKPTPSWFAKGGAVLSILAGLGVLVVEVQRFRSGAGIEIWLWGIIALFAIALGVYELVASARGSD